MWSVGFRPSLFESDGYIRIWEADKMITHHAYCMQCKAVGAVLWCEVGLVGQVYVQEHYIVLYVHEIRSAELHWAGLNIGGFLFLCWWHRHIQRWLLGFISLRLSKKVVKEHETLMSNMNWTLESPDLSFINNTTHQSNVPITSIWVKHWCNYAQK